MSGPSHEPSEPRIIKKKKSSAGHHGGAWKVAYADFVTAMMALFIVLWIMAQSQSVRQAVAQYFKDPGILPGATGIMETSDMGGAMPTPGHSQDLQTPAPVTPEAAQEKINLEEVKKRIEEMIAQLPELQKLKDQVLMEITSEGLRIELLEREDSAFFDVGSANLKPETKKVLSLIASELGGLHNKVTVEGHTDSRPYGTQAYTNWELSADRANAARCLMEATGLKPDQVFAVRGFADRQLRNTQEPLDFQNRRVGIIVMFQNSDHAVSLGTPRLPGKPEPPTAPKPPGPPKVPENDRHPGKVPVPGAQPDQPGTSASDLQPEVNPTPAPLDDMLMNETDAKAPEPDKILSDDLQQQLKPLKPQNRLGW
jgi:chemotaxis protein MotB